MKNIAEIEALKTKIDQVFQMIASLEYAQAEKEFQSVLLEATQAMTELIQVVTALKEYGVDIPTDILTAQMENLLQGYEYHDYSLIADTLHFEITDSLNLYIEIIEEMEKNNIVIS